MNTDGRIKARGPRLALLGVLLQIAANCWGASSLHIEVVALYKDAAVLLIGEEQRLLRTGQRSEEGVLLVSASSRQAVVEVEGETRTLELSRRMGAEFEPPGNSSVSIAKDRAGQYLVGGAINGLPVRFLLDTGATVIAMSVDRARQLGIDFAAARKGSTATASGTAVSYPVKLDEVQVGEIRVRNVDAVVLEGGQLPDILLGMSFLDHVEMKEADGVLRLTSKL